MENVERRILMSSWINYSINKWTECIWIELIENHESKRIGLTRDIRIR